MSVITISRQYGSGGDEIARLICQETGYRLFDKHILVRAALDAGLSDQEIFDYSEDNYKVKNVFQRLFGRGEPVARIHVWREDMLGVRSSELVALDEDQALILVRNAVEKAYEMGDIVILGRGGQVILKEKPGVLHVRIEAPFEERLDRVRGQLRAEGRVFASWLEERRAAQDLIEANDTTSADYLKRAYGVDWSDLQLYHLVINTGLLRFELAARAIQDIATRMEPNLQPAS
jgi:cytidylate kinase